MTTEGKTQSMTTAEFAKATGIPPATVSKLIRQGRLKARKRSGKWLIPPEQLDAPVVRELSGNLGSPAARVAPEPKTAARREQAPSGSSYSIGEFAAMTYLTEKGVAEWLKSGRLKGVRDEAGGLRVLASSLETADVKRLLRK